MKTSLLTFFLFCLNTSVIAGVIEGMGSYKDNNNGSYILETNTSTGFGTAATDSDVEKQLEIGLDSTAIQGAAIWGEFDILVGQTFSFDWYWYDTFSQINYNDFAFVSLKLNGSNILDEFFADTFTPYMQTDTTENYSWTATTSGNLEFGIGIMGASSKSDFEFANSSLNVSNIAVVPLPATLWLFLLGLSGLIGVRKIIS